MKRLLDQWERKNSKVKGQQTVDDWEREIADDEVMRDASPPPAPPSQPVVSDDSVELPAPLSGQVEALETVGICMLVEYMLAPPGAEEPQQLRAFWPDASAAEPVPAQNTEVLHDFMFRLFATCMAVWKSTSASGAPDNSLLSHFSAIVTRLSWFGRAARNRHRHAIEQASRRWRGGRRGDSARTRRKILIFTQVVAREGVEQFI